MSITDKRLLKKRALIETANDELKNITQIEHSNRHSFNSFITNLLFFLPLLHTVSLKRSQTLPCVFSKTDN